MEEVLNLFVLSGIEQLKTELNSLNVIIEGTIMHDLEEVFAESRNTEFYSNYC